MAKITLRGTECHTSGELPAIGSKAPEFTLADQDLADRHLKDFKGKKKLLNIVPSLDTSICAISTQKFSEAVENNDDTVLLVISADLPFAQKRFCTANNTESVVTLSTFRSTFPRDYGIEIIDGPFEGVTGRAVLVLDENDNVVYQELVPEISQEPDYPKALEYI